MKINYRLSDKYIKAVYIATGNKPSANAVLEIDDSELSIDERRIIVDAYPFLLNPISKNELTLKQDEGLASVILDTPLTRNEFMKHCAERPNLIAKAEAKRNREYAESKRKREAADKKREQQQAERRAQREKLHADRLAWAKEHGSERLVMALEKEYDCTRLYMTEFVTKTYPYGYLDFDEDISHKERVSPSLEGLRLADTYSRGRNDARLVWIDGYQPLPEGEYVRFTVDGYAVYVNVG